MIEMLELSHEDFKATIMKMPQWEIVDEHGSNKQTNKQTGLSKEIEDIKNNQKENFKLKKNSIIEDLKVKEAKERLSKLEDRTIEIIRSEPHRKNILKKINRDLDNYRATRKYKTFVPLQSHKEKRKRARLKTYAKK